MTSGSDPRTTISRPFRGDEDFWRVRDLLVETHPIAPTGFNWEVRRWDGWRFYSADPSWDPRWEILVRLWETADGRLIGAVHPEGGGDAHIEIHPDYRQIEEEMVRWAEEHLATPTEGGRERRLQIFVFDDDSSRRALLERRGYEQLSKGGVIRRLHFGGRPLAEPAMAEGYKLCTTRPGDEADCQRIADLLNAAFGRTFHTAGEHRTYTTHAPSFRPDLDLVAVAEDGSFAAYVGVPYDEANRCGIFEPVCTHPAHLRRGLARALMLEGLRRLQAMGAADVLVGTGDAIAANRLYDSIGFTEVHKGHEWLKTLPSEVAS